MKVIETRKCSKCGRVLPLTDEYFYKRKSNNSYRKQCKECFKNYDKMRHKEKKRMTAPRKTYDLVDPKTWEIVETVTSQELLDRLGVQFLGRNTMVDGLIITEN